MIDFAILLLVLCILFSVMYLGYRVDVSHCELKAQIEDFKQQSQFEQKQSTRTMWDEE